MRIPSHIRSTSSASLGAITMVLAILLILAASVLAQPGSAFPPGSALSDQKPGSILFYNFFSSSLTNPTAENTEISITNTNTTIGVTVRLFFVNGVTGVAVSTFVSLAPQQTWSSLVTDMAPGVQGYIVAVAVGGVSACPINFNYLTGDAYIKRASGHAASLAAIAVSAIAAPPAACVGSTSVLNFDGVNYNRMPRTLELTNITSRADGNDTLFILNRVGGNVSLGGGAATVGTLLGLLYDDIESGFNFTRSAVGPQLAISLTNNFPATTTPFEAIIPAGRSGWMKFWGLSDIGLLGASINFHPNAGTAPGAFTGGHNFSHRSLTTATLSIPLELSASAGSDKTVRVGNAVALDGSGSTAPSAPAYSWSFTGKPNGSTATLNGANTVSPTFTPDREGFYTIKLVVSAGGQSASDTVQVRAIALNCNSSSLSIFPVSLAIGKNRTQSITGFGGSRSYNWSIVTNASGGSLSSTSGLTISYTSGNNSGQDVIRMTDPWCGTKDLLVTVGSLDVAQLTVPRAVFLGDGLNVSATFTQPASQARACVYQIRSAPIRCQSMSLDTDGITYKTTLTTGDLAVGTYMTGVSGSNGSYGATREANTNIAQSRPPILLLNGYDFDGDDTDKHYLQWRQFSAENTSIECRLQQLYGHSQSCAKQNVTNCDPTNPTPDMVCVVDKLNGRKDIDFNRDRLSMYIADRQWLSSAKRLILIGHSYGGQISLAYAVDNPSKVQAVFTLDTPHLGALPGLVELQKARPGEDNAINFFTASGASKLNQQLSPRRIPNTHIYLVSSERLQHSAVVFAKYFTPFISTNLRVETDADDIVPVPSQRGEIGQNLLGGAYFGSGFNGTNVTRAERFRTTYIGSIFSLEGFLNTKFNLHNAIIEKPDLWARLYQKFGAYLSQEVVASTPGPPTASTLSRNTSTSEAGLNPSFPPTYAFQLIKSASGTATVSSPNSSPGFVVESGKDLSISLDSKNYNPNLILSGPGGITYTATTVNGLNSHYQVSQGSATITQSFLIRNPAAGNWTLSIAASNGGSGSNLPNSGASWEANVLIRSPISLQAELAESAYLSGESMKVKATVKQDASAMTGLPVTASITPSGGGPATNFTLFDDGAHDDGTAGDGVYGGAQTLSGTGGFDLAIITSGTSNLGSFQRQQIGSFTVATAESMLSSGFTESAPDANADGQYDSLDWSFTINVPQSGDYTVSGDLTDKDGTTIAGASVQIKALSAGMQPVTLTFLGRDIYASGREGPYILKNLRITVTTNDGEFLRGRPAETATTGGPYWSWLLFERAHTPLVQWLAPTSEEIIRGGSFDLKWTVEDGNGGATIDLYYDTTGSGFAGTPIVTGLQAVNGEIRYNWNLNSLPDGLYYVYAIVRNGDFSNALYGGSVRKLTDTDGDGMPDAWETAHGLNSNNAADAYLDPDGDLLTNLDEYLNNTNPQVADTDGGSEKDGSEVLNGRDPLTASDDATGVTLLAVSPGQGDSRGGDKVMVLGSGFLNGATVSFGGVAAPGVAFINSTKLLVTTPARAVGLTDVAVTNPASGGSATKTDAFNFLFQFIEPPIAVNNGPICAGAILSLAASTISGATNSWTGPNGFTSGQQNPSIISATTAASGTYAVTATIPGYTFPPATTNVIVNPIPTTPTISAPSSIAPGATGLMASVANQTGSFYNWTITNGTITAGQGTNQITFTAGAAGTLTLQVTQTNSGGCQSAPGSVSIPICAYSISPSGQSFTAAGGTGNVMVNTISGCAWTAISNDSWITITSGGGGSGNGTVTYSVAANTGAARTGRMTIAGRTFTVTQTPPSSSAFAAGTFFDRNGGLVGTSFIFNPVTPSGVLPFVDIRGPAGWNAGNSFRSNLSQPPETAANRSIGWLFTTPVTGIYSASGSVGGQSYEAESSISSSSTLAAPQITNLNVVPGQVTFTWAADSAAQSFLVRVNPIPFTGVTGEVVVPGSARTAALTGLSLVNGSQYQAVVFAFSLDITTPGALAEPFNIGAHSTTFTAPCQLPSITTQPGNQTVCAGSQASFSVNAAGTGLSYQWRKNGSNIPGATSSTYTIASATSGDAGAYDVVVSGACGQPIISATATLTIAQTCGLQYYPLPSPVRLLDTRPGESACFTPGVPLGNNAVRLQQAIVACTGIPSSAKAIVGNATVVNFNSGGGFITLFPSDATLPTSSNLNFTANHIVPNNFTVGLGPDGAFRIYSFASTHFIVDITGYYAPPGQGGLYYHPLPAPVRLFESRPGESGCDAPSAPLANDGTRAVLAHRSCFGATIPSTAKAIVGNATVVNIPAISSGFHYLTLYPFGVSRPTASNLNFRENQVAPNWFVVGLSNDGKFNIYSEGGTHFIVDVAGYFSEEAVDVNGPGLLYNPLSKPVRLLETRPGESGCNTPGAPLGNDSTLTLTAQGPCFGETIPATAKAVVGNATVVNFISSGFHWITLYPFGAGQPTASNLNYTLNQITPNAFWVGLSNDGKFNIYSHGSTHFIVDLTGYFVP